MVDKWLADESDYMLYRTILDDIHRSRINNGAYSWSLSGDIPYCNVYTVEDYKNAGKIYINLVHRGFLQ